MHPVLDTTAADPLAKPADLSRVVSCRPSDERPRVSGLRLAPGAGTNSTSAIRCWLFGPGRAAI